MMKHHNRLLRQWQYARKRKPVRAPVILHYVSVKDTLYTILIVVVFVTCSCIGLRCVFSPY